MFKDLFDTTFKWIVQWQYQYWKQSVPNFDADEFGYESEYVGHCDLGCFWSGLFWLEGPFVKWAILTQFLFTFSDKFWHFIRNYFPGGCFVQVFFQYISKENSCSKTYFILVLVMWWKESDLLTFHIVFHSTSPRKM